MTLRLLVLLAVLAPFARAAAQDTAARDSGAAAAGRELAAVPTLGYDSDEGFGYGADILLYDHRAGLRPYRYTLQPTVYLTTSGKRDINVFFDAPHLLPREWRVDAYAGNERQRFSPYYGIGNGTGYDATLKTDANPDWYAYDRTRTQLLLNVQLPLRGAPIRLLVGAGVARTTVNLLPRDRGTTLLVQDSGWTPASDAPAGWSNFVRVGLIWDTRDREIGPHRGAWSELLVQRIDRALGSSAGYTRWTFADRRYLPLGTRLTFANRLLLQKISGTAPFYDLYQVQTSFKQLEGLGGALTLRGIPKDRFVDDGVALWNAELRWRLGPVRALRRAWHLVLSGFADTGRVWGQEPLALTGLHAGYGGGVRLGMGESFIGGIDVGHSSLATLPFYIGLGYLY